MRFSRKSYKHHGFAPARAIRHNGGMRAYYSGDFVSHLPAGHRFPSEKYRLLYQRLLAELPAIQIVEAPAATDGQLALAHDPAYIQAVINGELTLAQEREIGFPWSSQLVERSRRSVGATIAAARAAMGLGMTRQGVAANMAGGTHHASSSKGGGFCVFNDVAVGARLMQTEYWRTHRSELRVAVIDLDVHQGNGTAEIFENDESVFTMSLHGEKNFPFRKVQGDLDVPLVDGTEDGAYLEALELALGVLATRFEPQLIFYLAGADCFVGDRLGRLRLSFDGVQARDRRVFDWAWQRRIPLAFVMAGGYGHHLSDTVQVQINTFTLALAYAQRWQNVSSSLTL
jgi:acetoin utilization deacetylase AcuC-like enzyme